MVDCAKGRRKGRKRRKEADGFRKLCMAALVLGIIGTAACFALALQAYGCVLDQLAQPAGEDALSDAMHHKTSAALTRSLMLLPLFVKSLLAGGLGMTACGLARRGTPVWGFAWKAGALLGLVATAELVCVAVSTFVWVPLGDYALQGAIIVFGTNSILAAPLWFAWAWCAHGCCQETLDEGTPSLQGTPHSAHD